MNRTLLTEHRSSEPVDLEDLLCRLLERVREEPADPIEPVPPRLEDGEVGETMLSLRLDGVTYRLLRDPAPDDHGHVALSPREQEIVRLVAKGLPNKAIAEVLDVSLWTVATHLRRVFAKLGVNSRAEMVAKALDAGLLRRVE